MRSITICILLFLISCEAPEQVSIELLGAHTSIVPENTTVVHYQFTTSTSTEAQLHIWSGTSPENVRVFKFSYGKHHHLKIPLHQPSTKYFYKFIPIQNKQPTTPLYTSEFETPQLPQRVLEYYDPSAQLPLETTLNGQLLFHHNRAPGCAIMTNTKGEVIWYKLTNNAIKSIRKTPDNSLLLLEDDAQNQFANANILLEQSLTGDTLFLLKQGQKGFVHQAHHDAIKDKKGNYILLTHATEQGVAGEGITQLDVAGNTLWTWNSFAANPYLEGQPYTEPWGNSIFLDSDEHYLLSLRKLSQVWKVNATSGKVEWKLGKDGDFPMEHSDEFQFQHFAHRAKDGSLLLFDNGGDDRPTSRVLAFEIEEEAKQVKTKTNITLPTPLYSRIMGSVMLLANQTYLVTSAVNGEIANVGADGTLLWSLKTKDRIYRTQYIELN